jgi:hypothetical protein
MYQQPKRLGCCSSGSVTGVSSFGDDPVTALVGPKDPTPPTIPHLFLMSVGAGLAVYLLTRRKR